jgi:hypothetical protein
VSEKNDRQVHIRTRDGRDVVDLIRGELADKDREIGRLQRRVRQLEEVCEIGSVNQDFAAMRVELEQARQEVQEARGWAKHGFELGQRSCTWSDQGVAPRWLLDSYPPGPARPETDNEMDRAAASEMNTKEQSTGWVAIADQIVGHLQKWRHFYIWDHTYYDTKAEAEGAGYPMADDEDADDFNVGKVENGILVWFGWMDEKFPEEDYAKVAAQFGWAVSGTERP